MGGGPSSLPQLGLFAGPAAPHLLLQPVQLGRQLGRGHSWGRGAITKASGPFAGRGSLCSSEQPLCSWRPFSGAKRPALSREGPPHPAERTPPLVHGHHLPPATSLPSSHLSLTLQGLPSTVCSSNSSPTSKRTSVVRTVVEVLM